MHDNVHFLPCPLAGIPDNADQGLVVGARLLDKEFIVLVPHETNVQLLRVIIPAANQEAHDRASPERARFQFFHGRFSTLRSAQNEVLADLAEGATLI